jgi:rhodanese-related sulfurtransferase
LSSPFRPAALEIEVDQVESALAAGAVLLDVREGWEYRRLRVPGVRHLPMAQLPGSIDTLPRDKRILVICEHGNRSLAVAEYLHRLGFEGVASVKGGTVAWARSDRPVERG